MADTGIFATTAEVQRKTGANASSTANVEAYINQFMTEAESTINTLCRYDFSTAYPNLKDQVKAILKDVASSMAAMSVINYDLDAIGRNTAETMLNVLSNTINRGLSLLKNKENQDFINGV